MRLGSEDPIAAALEAGVTVFDTARAYGESEALLARVLRGSGARIVTKGGMRREGAAWIPDGRAKSIRADCEASLAALDGLPIDLYLIHAPDPRTPWQTSVRALARLVDEGLVRRVGVSNVNRGRLEEARELAPITAVEVALNPFDDTAFRGGVVERCAELGIALIAHSPLGGPRRAGRLARSPELGAVARVHCVTAAEVALAWLLALSPMVVAIPGARRPETVRSAVRAATLQLAGAELAALNDSLGAARPASTRARTGIEVVVVMGIPGAGKSRVAGELAARGYERLNRDERGGSLRGLAVALDDRLAAGGRRIVLDNTYLTRAERSRVVEAAARHGAGARCIWVDTPLAQAQVNLVERLLDRFGALPSPEELHGRARKEAGLLAPTSQMRAARELEPPADDEGFVAVERIDFVREPPPKQARAGIFIAAEALRGGFCEAIDPNAPRLVFDWLPDAPPDALDDLAAQLAGEVETAVCPHGGGPPVCWCRPPLPGLLLAFARRAGVAPARSVLVGTSPAHRTLATALGARYVDAQNERT